MYWPSHLPITCPDKLIKQKLLDKYFKVQNKVFVSHILIQTHDIRNNVWVFSVIVEWLSITLLLYENIDVCNFSMKMYSLMLNLNKCNLRWNFTTQQTAAILYYNLQLIMYVHKQYWNASICWLVNAIALRNCCYFPTKIKRYVVIKVTTTIKARLLIRYNNKTKYLNITAWTFTQRCDHKLFSNLHLLFC